MATTIVQQAPAPAPPAANTDMMQMMMMVRAITNPACFAHALICDLRPAQNIMMQQQNEMSHARAMERQ